MQELGLTAPYSPLHLVWFPFSLPHVSLTSPAQIADNNMRRGWEACRHLGFPKWNLWQVCPFIIYFLILNSTPLKLSFLSSANEKLPLMCAQQWKPLQATWLLQFNLLSFILYWTKWSYLPLLMESPQAKPSLPKEWWAQLFLKPVPSSGSLSQPGDREGTPPARWDPLETAQSSGITLMLGWHPFSCFSLQSTSSSFPPFLTGVSQPPLVPLFSRLVWNLGKSGVVLSEFQSSLILWRSCSEFLSYSGLGNSGWLYPHNKAALMLQTSHFQHPLCKDKLFLPLNLSSISFS